MLFGFSDCTLRIEGNGRPEIAEEVDQDDTVHV